MAFSDNLASVDPWIFRPPFAAEPWISEALARDTEALTRAFQASMADTPTDPFQLVNVIQPETLQGQTYSSSGSDPDPGPKRVARVPPLATGKITKRKSRASKRSPTTFITADPANFRQMVQQVTGVRFSGGEIPVSQILKPAVQRPVTAGLPTLDTSAFLLDHHHHVAGPSSSGGAHVPVAPVVADGGKAALDFDGFSGFPTLESWKVM